MARNIFSGAEEEEKAEDGMFEIDKSIDFSVGKNCGSEMLPVYAVELSKYRFAIYSRIWGYKNILRFM